QVLLGVPPADRARAALTAPGCLRLGLGPPGPRVPVERALTERREFVDEFGSELPVEAGRHPDVMQRALLVVQAEEQAAHPDPVLVDAVSGHDAVGGPEVFDLEPAPLALAVRVFGALGDDPVETGALELVEPLLGDGVIARQ